MSTARTMKWITGALEILLGIPVLGAIIVVGLLWIPLAIMLVLHIVTLVITSREGGDKAPSILGIVTSCVAWIPIVGMIMHLITGILLMVSAAKKPNNTSANLQA